MLQLPRVLPSKVCVAWTCTLFHGQTGSYDSDTKTINLKEEFNITLAPISFFVNGLENSALRYGGLTVMPEMGSFDYSINSPAGEFILGVDFAFNVNPVKDDICTVASTLIEYQELVGDLSPMIFRPHSPEEMWGSKGFLWLLQDIHEDSSTALVGTTEKISTCARQGRFFADFLSECHAILLAKDRKQNLAEKIQHALMEESAPGDIVNMLAMNLCSAMTILADDPLIDIAFLPYMANVGYQTNTFITKKCRQFADIGGSFVLMSKHCLAVMLKHEHNTIRELAHFPSPLAVFVNRIHECFADYLYMWPPVERRILMESDFEAAGHVIMSESETKLASYRTVFPQYEWPYLATIDALRSKVDIVILPWAFKAQWASIVIEHQKEIKGPYAKRVTEEQGFFLDEDSYIQGCPQFDFEMTE